MNPFDLQVAKLPMTYRGRIARVLQESKQRVLSQASVALYISGIFLHLHPADDPMMVTFEQTPEHLSLAVRVQDAAVGDTLKLVRRQEKPFFGVLVNTEGLIFSYQEHGQDRGCRIDSLQDLGAQLKPLEIRVYKRR
ncbi:hypothetical protein J4208_03485 [Candidatus Woesearchaeota archaeon]|nr:hypothetical protein [Candidatus Woesearchaeota archaeon]